MVDLRDQTHDSLFYLVHLGTRKPMQQNNVPALHIPEGSFGLTSRALTAAAGTNSCNS